MGRENNLQDNVRGFMRVMGLFSHMLDKNRYRRKLHRLEPLLCCLFFVQVWLAKLYAQKQRIPDTIFCSRN